MNRVLSLLLAAVGLAALAGCAGAVDRAPPSDFDLFHGFPYNIKAG